MRIITMLYLIFNLLTLEVLAQHYTKSGKLDMRYKENKAFSPPRKTIQSSIHSRKHEYNYSAKRNTKGRIKRSQKMRNKFMKDSGYPHGRKGYVVDHILPLKKGGCDCPSNMQWQTKEAAKAKDKWEMP